MLIKPFNTMPTVYAHPVRVGTIAFVLARLCLHSLHSLQLDRLLAAVHHRKTRYCLAVRNCARILTSSSVACCRLRHIHRGDIHRESTIFHHCFDLHAYVVLTHHAVAFVTYLAACSRQYLFPIYKVPHACRRCNPRPKSCSCCNPCNPWRVNWVVVLRTLCRITLLCSTLSCLLSMRRKYL